MFTETLFLAHLIAAIGCGTIGGVFFAFSTFVMKALGRLPTAHAAAAMQSINVVVLNPLFLGTFAGTAVLGLALAVLALLNTAPIGALIGGVVYGLGTFGVTIVGNVPLNNRLAVIDPRSSEAETVWREYLRRWTFWNHVRTGSALIACAALIWTTRYLL